VLATASDPRQVIKIKALGFMGIMAQGAHHQVHLSTPGRFYVGRPEQKCITASSKKAPDIGGLLVFAAQS
jgi:hypothetical protein